MEEGVKLSNAVERYALGGFVRLRGGVLKLYEDKSATSGSNCIEIFMKKAIVLVSAALLGVFPCLAQDWWEAEEPKEIFVKYSEYDKNGNVTYTERASGFKEWREYNSFGKLQHSKNTAGDEVWYEYDSKGNALSYKTQLGDLFSCNFKYDSKGNLILKEFSSGNTVTFEYNEKNLLIHEKDSNGMERWYDYDSAGRKVKERRVLLGDEATATFFYDSNDNLVLQKQKIGKVATEEKFEYNSANKRTKRFLNGILKSEYFYNANNYLEREKNYISGGPAEELKYEYTYYPDGKIKSMKIFEIK